MKEENTNKNWHLVFRRGLTSLYIIIIIPGSLVNLLKVIYFHFTRNIMSDQLESVSDLQILVLVSDMVVWTTTL